MTTTQAPTKRERDAAIRELVLDALQRREKRDDICRRVRAELGEYIDDNYITRISYRARSSGDPRAVRASGRKGHAHTTFGGRPVRAKLPGPTTAAPIPKPLNDMFTSIPPPDFARPVPLMQCRPITSEDSQCRFPLRGEGVGLIVCGARCLPAKSVCAYHARIYFASS